MAPDDTPNPPNAQTTGTATPETQNQQPPAVDPAKQAAEDQLAAFIRNGDAYDAAKLVAQGVNPNVTVTGGGTALGSVSETGNAALDGNLSLATLNAGDMATAPAPPPPAPPAQDVTTADGVVPPPDNNKDVRALEALIGGAFLLGELAPDMPAAAATYMAADTVSRTLGDSTAADATTADQTTSDAMPIATMELDEGIVLDGTISDLEPTNVGGIDGNDFQYGFDADNIADTTPTFTMADYDAPEDFSFADNSFGDNNFTMGDLGTQPLTLSQIDMSFPTIGDAGPMTLADTGAPAPGGANGVTTGDAPTVADTGNTGFNFMPLATAGLTDIALTDMAPVLPGVNTSAVGNFVLADALLNTASPPPPPSTAADTTTADAPAPAASNFTPLTIATDVALLDLAASGGLNPVTPTLATLAAADTLLTATATPPAQTATIADTATPPPAGPDPFATATTPTVVAAAPPAGPDPFAGANQPVASQPPAGPDPFASTVNLATTAAAIDLGISSGPAASSFLGGTLASYVPPAANAAIEAPVVSSFGNLAGLSTTGGASVYSTSFFNPVTVAATLNAPDPAAPAASPPAPTVRASASMGMSG
jgi:hypothetical protein